MNSSAGDARRRSGTYGPAIGFFIPLILVSILAASGFGNYLLFHTLAELFSVMVAVLGALVVWQTYPFSRNDFLFYLAIGLFWCAAIDLAHTFTYKGMIRLDGIGGADESTQFWLAARYLQAFVTVTAPLFLRRRLNPALAVIGLGAAALLLGVLVVDGRFPAAYLPGSGLTPFKIVSEYVIAATFVIALFCLWRERRLVDEEMYRLLSLSIIFTILSELCFTLYADVYGLSNMVGHVFKLLAYWYLFVAIVRTTLETPFRALSGRASSYDAVPDPTVVIDEKGLVRQANLAACRLSGLGWTDIVGRPCHDVFHPQGVSAAQCPVCTLLAAGGEDRTVEAGVGERWYEYTFSPVEGMDYLAGTVQVMRDVTEARRAQADLHRWGQIFELADWGVAIGSADGTRTEMLNRAFARMHGATVEEILELPLLELFAPEVREQIPAEIERANREGRHAFESLHVRKDGSRFPVLVHATAVHDEAGNVLYRVVNVRDITAELHAREVLERSRARMAEAQRIARLGNWEWEEGSDRLFWSDELYRIYGLEPGEPMGPRRFNDLLHPEDRAMVDARFAATWGRGEPFRLEYRIVRPDRQVRVLHCEAQLEALATGGRRLAGVSQDITERKMAELALRSSEASLAEAEALAHVGSWEIDLEAGRAFWSDEQYRILGYRPGEVEASYDNFLNVIHPEDRKTMEAAVAAATTGGSRLLSIDYRVVRESGEVRYVSGRARVYIGADGRPFRMVGASLDVTERELADQEIRRLYENLERRVTQRTTELRLANQELESFAYSVSHDLRAPLRSIDGFSQLVLTRYGEGLDATGCDYLERVRRATQRMGEMIDALLSLSRVIRSELRRAPVDLAALAREVAGELQQAAPERRVRFDFPRHAEVVGDPRLLRIVLDNLLGNAWKFTARREQAEIGLSVEATEEGWECCVRDNGAGFDPRFADKLFAAFQRLHRPEEFEGTGIGLATVARIVHRHHGRVWASGVPEAGATFHFTLSRQ